MRTLIYIRVSLWHPTSCSVSLFKNIYITRKFDVVDTCVFVNDNSKVSIFCQKLKQKIFSFPFAKELRFLKVVLKIKLRQNGSRHQSQVHEEGPEDGAQKQGYLLASAGQTLQVPGP